MRNLILILICLVALYLLYEYVPRCERREFRENESIVKRDPNTYVVLSLSEDGVAKFYAVPKSEIDQMKPVNYNNYVYHFYSNGVFKKGARNSYVGDEVSLKLKDGTIEKDFITKIRQGRYRLVHSEPNYTYKSSVYGFSNRDYDLVVRTTH